MKFTVSALIGLFLSTALVSQVKITTNFPTALKGGSAIDMEVKIEKMGIANFAKYQMDVPAGVTVEERESKTGNFTFENNRAKIVWVSIPTEAEVVVKFKVSVPASLPSPSYISQKFFYLDNGSKKEVDAEAITFTVAEGAVAVTNTPKKEEPMSLHNTAKKGKAKLDTVTGIYKPEPVTKKEETTKTETKKQEVAKTETPKKEEPVKKQEVAKTETPKKEEPVKTETPKTETKKSEPIAGTIYRIQLAAGATDPGKAKYAAAGDVEVLKEGGMFKVLTGNCATKEEALKLREQLIAKGLTGFVVAYSNGVRVK